MSYGCEISCRKSQHDVVSGKHLAELHWHAGSWGKRNTGFKISDAKQDLLKRVVSLTFVMPPSNSIVWTSNTLDCHCSKLCATGSQFSTRCRKIFISCNCLLHTFWLCPVLICFLSADRKHLCCMWKLMEVVLLKTKASGSIRCAWS